MKLIEWDFEYLEKGIGCLTNSSGSGFRIALRDWLMVDGKQEPATIGQAALLYLEWLKGMIAQHCK